EEDLQADLVAMRKVYRERGWLDAVVELDRYEFDAQRSRVTIHVRIDEGERYRVSSLAIEGVEWQFPDDAGDDRTRPVELIFDQADLLERCSLGPGAIYEAAVQNKDLVTLREY